jgi:hypothetical protein
MSHLFDLAEAQALLPEARRRSADAAAVLERLEQLMDQLRLGTAPPGVVDEAAALEAAVDDALAWFEAKGVRVRSLSPPLLDFPARALRDGQELDVLLCWRGDEEAIAYYHPATTGYRTREPVAMLDRV